MSVNGRPARLSFEGFVEQVLAHAEPLSQNTREHDLGFGWLYYAFIRNVRPEIVIAIGSRRGFMPFCAARATLDNGLGKVFFIDPSYSGYGHPGWSGAGLWSNPAEVAARIEAHGLTDWIEHVRLESADAFALLRDKIGSPKPGVVIVDGAHTHENSLEDFALYSSLFSEGFVLFHDATAPDTGVPRTIRELRDRGVPQITLYRDVGLSIAEITPRKAFGEAWGYLCTPTNRSDRIAQIVEPLGRQSDAVMDAYCGVSPVAPLLNCGCVFGFDGDYDCISQLRAVYPQHTWRQIEERALPFAQDLPDKIDLLMALGITHGYVSWDPQHVVNNLRYLIGRYVPRVCVLEGAADYHEAAILQDLKPSLTRLGYHCQYQWFNTDLASYARRKILIAVRH